MTASSLFRPRWITSPVFSEVFSCAFRRGQDTIRLDSHGRRKARAYEYPLWTLNGERFCTEFSLTLDDDRTYTTREYFELLGRAMAPKAKQEGKCG